MIELILLFIVILPIIYALKNEHGCSKGGKHKYAYDDSSTLYCEKCDEEWQ